MSEGRLASANDGEDDAILNANKEVNESRMVRTYIKRFDLAQKSRMSCMEPGEPSEARGSSELALMQLKGNPKI